MTEEKREQWRIYLCRNQRRLHRRFLRYISAAIFILSLITTTLLVVRDVLNQRMLKARARIQIALIDTAVRRNAFTEDELNIIREQWDAAEYDKVQKEMPTPKHFDGTSQLTDKVQK